MPNSNSNVTWTVWRYMETTPEGERLYYAIGNCLTGDEKPTQNIYNGSILHELNTTTGDVTDYVFNYATKAWVETTGNVSPGVASLTNWSTTGL